MGLGVPAGRAAPVLAGRAALVTAKRKTHHEIDFKNSLRGGGGGILLINEWLFFTNEISVLTNLTTAKGRFTTEVGERSPALGLHLPAVPGAAGGAGGEGTPPPLVPKSEPNQGNGAAPQPKQATKSRGRANNRHVPGREDIGAPKEKPTPRQHQEARGFTREMCRGEKKKKKVL